jgi:NAD(P)-dependent dehydrogenase (short-subunit alcohol dehydrogenase family)
LDVTDRDSFQAFIDAVERRLGPVDVLINNAGVMSLSPFTDETDEVSERMHLVNLHGPMLGMKIMIPRMLGRGRGHIVNVVSSAGRFGLPGAVMYSASKFGALGLTDAAAAEYARTPLKFSAICPVVVQTELSHGVSKRTRLAPTLLPEDVARAIVKTIEKPKLIAYVPSHVRFSYLLVLILPLRARRALERFTRIDRLLIEIDLEARREYDRRAFGDRG